MERERWAAPGQAIRIERKVGSFGSLAEQGDEQRKEILSHKYVSLLHNNDHRALTVPAAVEVIETIHERIPVVPKYEGNSSFSANSAKRPAASTILRESSRRTTPPGASAATFSWGTRSPARATTTQGPTGDARSNDVAELLTDTPHESTDRISYTCASQQSH
ncbi:hypothetical protein [Micromonospora chokoriensis]|uniref:hypothetical protein n=1 Tax=Micromonospora chokoriensis TaxID=356851 RepID=UPI0012FD26B9|nr:hypothetical protein [Micromonospora chokoriensis]